MHEGSTEQPDPVDSRTPVNLLVMQPSFSASTLICAMTRAGVRSECDVGSFQDCTATAMQTASETHETEARQLGPPLKPARTV